MIYISIFESVSIGNLTDLDLRGLSTLRGFTSDSSVDLDIRGLRVLTGFTFSDSVGFANDLMSTTSPHAISPFL